MPPKPKPTHKKVCVDKRGKFKKCPPQPRRPKVTAKQIAALKADKLAKQERVKRLRKDIKNLPSGSLESRLKREQLAKVLISLGGRGEQKDEKGKVGTPRISTPRVSTPRVSTPRGSISNISTSTIIPNKTFEPSATTATSGISKIQPLTRKQKRKWKENRVIDPSLPVPNYHRYYPDSGILRFVGELDELTSGELGVVGGLPKEIRPTKKMGKPPEGNRPNPFGYYDFPDAEQFFSNYNS